MSIFCEKNAQGHAAIAAESLASRKSLSIKLMIWGRRLSAAFSGMPFGHFSHENDH